MFNQSLIKIIEAYVKKGTKIVVEGQNKTRKWEKDGQTHYSTEVVLTNFNRRIPLEGQPQARPAKPTTAHNHTATARRKTNLRPRFR